MKPWTTSFAHSFWSRITKRVKRLAKTRLKPHLKVEVLEERRVLAREIGMLNDLNAQEAMRGAKILLSDQVLFMTRNSPEKGSELWIYDNFIPFLTDDIWPGAQSSNPHDLVIFNNELYFGANDGLVGDELWKRPNNFSFGGAQLAVDIRPGAAGSEIDNLIVVGNELYFTANDGTNGNELWKMSTTGARSLVRDIALGAASSSPDGLMNIGNRLFFTANDGVTGRELWTSDGSAGGTMLVSNLGAGALSSSPKYMTNVNGDLYFAADSNVDGVNELWRTTSFFTGQISQSISQPISIDNPTQLFNYNGTLVFTATSTGVGREFWKVDNSTLTGVLVSDLAVGPTPSSPNSFVMLGNTLYFVATVTNPTLFRSDGTTAGTISTGRALNNPGPLVNIGGKLYFGRGNELQSFDGTTFDVLTEWASPGRADSIVAFQNRVFFTDTGFREDLWYLNAGNARTATDTNTYSASAAITQLVEAGGALFVDSAFPFGSSSIAGTLTRVDQNSLEYEGINFHNVKPRSIINVGGTVYYFAGRELHKNSGTRNTASTFITSFTSTSLTGLNELTNVSGTVYFSMNDGTVPGLWKTDGTTAGTTSVFRFNVAQPRSLINVGGVLYFVAAENAGLEVWRSNGTLAGTVQVANIAPGVLDANPENLTNVGGILYFTANDANNGVELWRTDGTLSGTVMVRNIAAGAASSSPTSLLNMGGVLYFTADDGINGRELWKSDGTLAGTVMVRDIRTGSASSNPTELTNVGGKLYLAADDGTRGRELWSSDGTLAGTTLVSDIVLGPTGSDPTRLMNFNGALYFTPDIRPVGQRLWKSDGTASSTVEVVNAANRNSPQVASKMVAANGKLFFTGRTEQFGIELFAMGDADYGDAAGTYTAAANLGAASFANGPMLGTQRDATENDGVPSTLANSDDLGGIDDEDGLNAPIVGAVGGTVSVSLTVSNATSNTKLTAYIDFDQNGRFTDDMERVAYALTLVNGVNNLNFNVPLSAKLGTTTARFRISDNFNTFGLGLALSGETEDHLVTLERSSTVTLPTTGANDIVIRKSGANVEVVNRVNSAVLFTDSLATLSRLIVVGADTQSDTVLIDYVSGGFFGLLGGLEVNGQGGADSLTVNASGTAQAVYTLASSNRPQLTFTQASQPSIVIYTNFETQTFNGLQSFVTTDTFHIGANSITIGAVDPVSLASTTTINGGTLTATAITLASSYTLSGFGMIAGNFAGQTNSTLMLGGNLTIGNAASTSGFATLGSINTNANTLTLLDANDVRLGSSTTLGSGSNAGRIVAAKGLQVANGTQLNGVGTIDTPLDSNFPLVNNGTIAGTGSSNRITIGGYVTGTGVLNRVNVAGTASPGSNLMVTNYGDVRYSGSLVIELGGTTPGTGYDQVSHSDVVNLAGTLDVRLINGFVPSVGSQFTVLFASGGLTGTFTNLLLPTVPGGLQWDVGYTATSVKLQLAALAMSLANSSISENGGTTTGTVSRNSYDLSQSLTVNLASSDTTEATVPTTVTIPAGQASATFPITAVDDTLLDGSQTVTISAAATGFAGDSKTLTVTDFETLSVSIAPSSISEKDGVATGTVTRNNTNIDAAVVITLLSNDVSEATVPASVTIPAGSASATFSITAVDDVLLDGSQTVQVTASGVGYVSGSASLTVTDSENLTVTSDLASISELGGLTLGRVFRSNTDTAAAIIVNLQSSDTTEATVPATVVIPAGQSQANFLISAVDDTLLDGTQTVTITASLAGYISGSKSLDVTDLETLSLTTSASAMSENGGSITGTVTRSNTDIAAPVIVTLVSDDTSEATVPATVTIPAGQASTTFTINAVDDTLLDGTQRVTLTATSTGYQAGTRAIDVTDSETLSLSIAPGAMSEKGGTATGTVTRSNTDTAASVTVTLVSSDTTEASVPSVVTIPAGQASASFTITAVDDNLLDGTQTVQISASGAGYFGNSQSLSVQDFEQLQLSINQTAINELNGTATGTVTRPNTDISLPLTVNLQSDDTTEATVPATVTIPANQTSATFVITAVDDSLQDGTQTANITASATGYVSTVKSIDVMDSVSLSLNINAARISENGGTTIATIVRNNLNIDAPLTVLVSSSDTTEATVPASVIIPANQSSVTFTINAVDDSLLDGNQVVTISVSATGFAAASKSLTVDDYELLDLTIAASSINEKGGVTSGRVTRTNTDLAQSIAVNLTINDTSEAVVPATVIIAAGQASANFTITAIDDNLLDGTQQVLLTAASAGYLSASSSLDVTDSENLIVEINVAAISELGGQTQGRVTRSNTDTASAITVNLLSSDTTEATVPATVVIPAGQSQANFLISAVDDMLLDGTQTVTITASLAGYISGSKSLDVTDLETLSLTTSASAMSENGGTITGTVTRSNTDIAAPVIVTLVSDDTSEATVPATVTIPAGQASTTFTINAVDDTLLDGTQRVTLTATSTGYQAGTRAIDVTDSETLSLSIAPGTMSEKGGTATGTVTRSNTDTAASVTVTLASSDTTEASVPSVVTIPAGQALASFTITAVDDNLLDGTQTVQISASGAGYFGNSQSLSVQDFEQLQLSIDQTAINELNGTATGTVTRPNTDISLPLTVNLLSDDTTEATVPATVTIPANQTSATFVITAVDDTLLDGTQRILLTAGSAGYESASSNLDVTDSETLSVSIDKTSMSEKGGTASITITRSNTDVASSLTVQLLSNDTTELVVPVSVTIPANQASLSLAVNAVDDMLLDGAQLVVITASATGYSDGSSTITVDDSEELTVSLSASIMSEQGGTTTGTVTRSNTNVESALTVTLSSSDTSETLVPVSVTIPAGQSSVAFAVEAVDDSLLDGEQSVTVQASAAGYANGQAIVKVRDSESLGLAVSPATISEKGGATTATLTRSNTDIAQSLDVQLHSSDTSEATVPALVTIPAGQSSISFVILSVDDALLDGTQLVNISATSLGYESIETPLSVSDWEELGLTFDKSSFSEKGGTAQATLRRSNTDVSTALTVNMLSSDTNELTVPATVVIPAGQTSVVFDLIGVDDDLLDGTQSVQVTAAAPGYASSEKFLDVTDSEVLMLTLSASSMSENAGRIRATVTRSNSDMAAPLSVTVGNPDSSELAAPATVTIPANQASVEFELTAIDDGLLDGEQSVQMTVSADGYASATQALTVTDYVLLALVIDKAQISENGGTARGTVSRSNSDLDSPLVVQLSSHDVSEITVPMEVTIPANANSVSFDVLAVDDALLDGLQSVSILASSSGYQASSHSIDVLDFETLTLTIDVLSISEKNGVAIGTVQRSNSDNTAPLVVTLGGSDATEANVPASVTILAGQSSVTFAIQSVNDTLVDGPQVVAVTASASGYVSSAKDLTVLDDDRQFPWQSPRNPLDVNDSGQVTALDALLVINGLNTRMELTPQLPDPFIPVAYVDVNGDGFLTPIDALLVINELNNPSSGEGEPMPMDFATPMIEELSRNRRRSF